MTIDFYEISVAALSEGYADNGENGVHGYNGNLNIRPAYQREFVYGEKERSAVIDSVIKGFPLGSIYWACIGNDKYELLDGQQRTISICQFVNNEFSINLDGHPVYFRNIKDTEVGQRILNYRLYTFVCNNATKSELLNWFRTINIAGVKLAEQELLNATYCGPWLEDAKKYFSRNNCPAYNQSKKYVNGSPIRQDFLETAIDWISDGDIANYMALHQNDFNANELVNHFTNVIDWVKSTFFNYRSEMKGLNWGKLYKNYSNKTYNPVDLDMSISLLMSNEEVTDKKGIYEYVLSGEDESLARKLSKRTFSEADKRTVYEQQKGICPICGEKHSFSEMEGDHIVPWWRGGKTTFENLQMLCVKCNRGKAGKMKV